MQISTGPPTGGCGGVRIKTKSNLFFTVSVSIGVMRASDKKVPIPNSLWLTLPAQVADHASQGHLRLASVCLRRFTLDIAVVYVYCTVVVKTLP